MTSNCVLIADARERNVLRHKNELAAIKLEIKQITTADYVVIAPGSPDTILAVIERKSLDDYGASIKDGRHLNKEKLVAMRDKTGCKIVYIIEGPAFPKPTDRFGGIPYKHIQSSMFHLMIRENAVVIFTRDTLHTATTLVDFVLSMDTLLKRGYVGGVAPSAPIDELVAPMPAPIDDLLTHRHTKGDHEVVREMWSKFKGITVETAVEYMRVWSIADIICNRIPQVDIREFKLSSGHKIRRNASTGLYGMTPDLGLRILATVPGISLPTARQILTGRTLAEVLNRGPATESFLAAILVGATTRRALGKERAAKCIRLLEYKTPAPIAADSSDDEPIMPERVAEIQAAHDRLGLVMQNPHMVSPQLGPPVDLDYKLDSAEIAFLLGTE